MPSDVVSLTVAPNEFAADEIQSFLRTAGIESIQRKTNLGVGMADAGQSAFGPREIFVKPDDLDAARDLIEETE
jgi:hypothetical protein